MPRARPDVAIGRAVRRARAATGLTQAGLAEATDLAVETVSRIERGTVSPSALVRDVARAMAVAGGITLLVSAAAWLAALVSGGRAVVPRVTRP